MLCFLRAGATIHNVVQIVEFVLAKLEVRPADSACLPCHVHQASSARASCCCVLFARLLRMDVQERPAVLHALENAAAALHTPSDVFLALFDKTVPTMCGLAGMLHGPSARSERPQQAAVHAEQHLSESPALSVSNLQEFDLANHKLAEKPLCLEDTFSCAREVTPLICFSVHLLQHAESFK